MAGMNQDLESRKGRGSGRGWGDRPWPPAGRRRTFWANILGRLLKRGEKSPPALLVCPWLLWSGLGKHSRARAPGPWAQWPLTPPHPAARAAWQPLMPRSRPALALPPSGLGHGSHSHFCSPWRVTLTCLDAVRLTRTASARPRPEGPDRWRGGGS